MDIFSKNYTFFRSKTQAFPFIGIEVFMKNMKNILFLPFITLALLFCACSSANSAEAALREAFGTNERAVSPVFLGCKAVSPKRIAFRFSLPVTVASLNFNPALAVESIGEGDEVFVDLSEETEAGVQITADILVEDERKNTLNALTVFRARNDRLPHFLITELRTEASKPKGEFVELKTLTDGNLGALRLFTASCGIDAPIFECDPVEVKKGEYIVIHLRSYEEGSINETGKNLSASYAADSQNSARDFWLAGAAKKLRKTDAVFFMDQDDAVIDAVIFSADGTWGSKTYAGNMEKAAQLLKEKGAWKFSGETPSPTDAFSSAATTATRTICRWETKENSNSATDWYITVSGGATPGKPNNKNKYVPK
jgi:hypothetical protein